MSRVALLVNGAIALAILTGYVILTALHDDGNALLGLLGGQGITALAAKITDTTTAGTAPNG